MKKNYFVKLITPVFILLGWNFSAVAQTTTFSTAGGPYAYTVPPCTFSVGIVANGGAGGTCNTGLPGVSSAKGGRVTCNLAVTPGQVLNVYVGGQGGTGNGSTTVAGGINGGGSAAPQPGNGGGSGGGGSDIRVAPFAIANRVVVAGGGGGDGYNGGDMPGGVGGGLTGGNGATTGCGTAGQGGSQSTGGAGGGYSCLGYTVGSNGALFQGGASQTPNPGIGGGGGGGYYGGGGGGWSGGGGGSSYTDATLCTSVLHTQGVNTGDGSVTITPLCTPPTPGTISGNNPMCPGGVTEPLTIIASATCGTWSSSNTSVATVSSTGVVTSVGSGVATISYSVVLTCGSAITTAPLTINPLPAAITGAPGVCLASTTTLTDATGGGTWSSSAPSTAAVSGSTGVVSGVSLGSATITYTLPTGCYVTAPIVVNNAPLAITGASAVCVNGTTTLSDATSGGSWTSNNISLATVGAGSGTVTGLNPGVDTIVYTLPTGCSAVAPILVNPLPASIGGIPAVCVGSTTTLTDATPGGTWSIANPSLASINIVTGSVGGIVAGSTTVFYTLGSTGCKTSVPMVINPLPAAITGSNNVCVGSTTTLGDVSAGGTWSSSNPALAAVGAVTGIVTGMSSGTATITYTLITSCSSTMSMLVNPQPAPFAMTGGGAYCAGTGGVHVGLAFSNAGVNYQLYFGGVATGSPVAGSGAGLDFGLQTAAGTYTAKGTNTSTGCVSNMTGSEVITIYGLPPLHNVTGGGGYCAGGTGVGIGLDGSNTGIKYQLYNGTSPVGAAVSGTGLPITFGTFTTVGTYTVIATNIATGCQEAMTGSTSVSINPLPNVYPVSGGGGYCAGGTGVHIVLLNSDAGDTYEVMYMGSVVGTASSLGGYLDLGAFTAAGVYTVVGIDGSTFCQNNMSGSASVIVNPLPAKYSVTPTSASYCVGSSGVHVGLSFSTVGVDYSLWYAGSPLDTVHGSGSGLDFGAQTNIGTYTVIGTNATTGCTNLMTGSANIGVNPLPFSWNVGGGGHYCVGGTGKTITTNGSDLSTNYQVFRGTTPVGTPVPGTGIGLTFGPYTSPGVYTILATSTFTTCAALQSGSATITADPLPVIYNVTGGGHFCAGDTGVHVRQNNSQVGVNYQLLVGGFPTGTIVAGTGGALDFGLQTGAGVYTAIATNTTTGCSSTMAGSATVIVNPAPTVYNVIGGGGYCAGGAGVHIGLDGSSTGVVYQLHLTSPVGAPLAGTGTALDFGPKTAGGAYTVTATNVITGCTATMNGSQDIVVNPLPTPYTVTGGGNYCAGGLGLDISLLNSDTGTVYQLKLGGTLVGSPVSGVGAALDFGLQTLSGTYTVVGTNSFGCSGNMSGAAPIHIISPAVFAMGGGGNYCAGGTGVVVTLGGSATSETYQLYDDTGAVGAPVSGTGSSLSFGMQTFAGTYIVVATNILYGCTDTMGGHSTVGINALPALNNVTGGGAYCSGGSGVHVNLSGTSTGITYQLYNGSTTSGAAVPGTGSALDFGAKTAAGSYYVVARNASTGCTDTMSGRAVITIKPLPTPYVVGIENDGYYCASDTSGVHIYLGSSDTDVNYQLWRGATLITSATGTGAIIDFGAELIAGTYSVTAMDTGVGGCSNNMSGTVNVTIMPLPTVHDVTGGGGFCPGAPGVHIGLNASDLGIRYTIRRVGFPGDTSSIWGNGYPLDFGIYDSLGSYVVTGIAHHLLTGCANDMFGTAVVSLDTILTPTVSIKQYPNNGVGVFHIDSMHAFVANGGSTPTYQWIINGHIIVGATNASFTHQVFFDRDSVACVVTASGPCGGNTTSRYALVHLKDVGVTVISTKSADVKLVPNPNKGAFTIKGDLGLATDEEVSIEVTNMLGQVMYSGKVMTQNGSIDQRIELSNAANGMYILNLRAAGQNSVIHFVVAQ